MTKREFLEALNKALGTVPEDVKAEILGDFAEHFDAGASEGKSEAAVAAALGEPRRIAKLYFADDAVKRAQKKASLKNVLSMVLAVLRYKLGGGLAVGAAYLICLCVTALFLLCAVTFFLGGLGTAALAIASALKNIWPYFLPYLCALLLFLSAGGLMLNSATAFFKKTVGRMPRFAERVTGRKRKGGNAHA
ncbi:MAG: DUF1700 domain-containing protein [Eubacteriales bacterium]|nr:DUF1700 domain-containing protein [Eubacteriales bacterium]